jgi:hypothetical protein
MFNVSIRLAIAVAQLILVHYIFSNIRFTEGNKIEGKTALKNYLHGFLFYVIGFSSSLYMFTQTLGFPQEFHTPLFLIGFMLYTIMWIGKYYKLIISHLKNTVLYQTMQGEYSKIKEGMDVDYRVSSKYPMHFYEPIMKNTNKYIKIKKPAFMEQPKNAKMILQKS